ncbi:MAG: glycosyltransferase family 4 protein [Planctomycetota bacterium]|nr:glycosyltransferase family 4 protein [Planctomycetota bacterium]
MTDRRERRVRPLLIAEACNPTWVSVPLVGWSHTQAISKLTDAHLVTQIRNRDALVGAGLVEGHDFTAIDSEPVARPIYALAGMLRGGKGKGWTTTTALSSASYPYFEHLVWKKFGSRLMAGEFDVVHRVTPLSPTIPSSLASRCKAVGVPFVLGPLNGGVPWPPGFDSARRAEKEWLSYVRDAYRLLPGYLQTRRNAAAILIGSRDTWLQLPRSFRGKSFYVPENAIDPARFALVRRRKAERPIRAVFIGRLVPYKGVDMLLEAAMPILQSGGMTLDIIGDGPMMAQLRTTVETERLGSAVNLAGWIEHSKLQNLLVDADVFAFPSIREFGGGVVLEAMAVGVVPIVVAYGGPGELVTPQTGFPVPMGSREQIISMFRTLLSDLAAKPAQIDEKSQAAIHRARTFFTWDAKAARVLEIYRWVRGMDPRRPQYPMPEP